MPPKVSIAVVAAVCALIAGCGGGQSSSSNGASGAHGALQLVLQGPRPGQVVHSPAIAVHGTVTPGAAVRVTAPDGSSMPAQVVSGRFSATVPIPLGHAAIALAATKSGYSPALTSVAVVRSAGAGSPGKRPSSTGTPHSGGGVPSTVPRHRHGASVEPPFGPAPASRRPQPWRGSARAAYLAALHECRSRGVAAIAREVHQSALEPSTVAYAYSRQRFSGAQNQAAAYDGCQRGFGG